MLLQWQCQHFLCPRLTHAHAVNPGFGGQGFIQSQVKKIQKLKEMCNEYGVNPWIEVDGGVSPGNAAEVGLAYTLG